MKCPKCNQTESDGAEFYKPSKKTGKRQSYCKKCNHENTLQRQQLFKIRCLEYKGSKCVKCGYDKCNAALEFHHRDPSQKEINFSKYRNTSWDKNKQLVISELDKCDLLCANCHREAHHG